MALQYILKSRFSDMLIKMPPRLLAKTVFSVRLMNITKTTSEGENKNNINNCMDVRTNGKNKNKNLFSDKKSGKL